MKFKTGDRVRCIISNDKPKFRALGTVYSTDTTVDVNWDEDCGGNKIEEFGVMKGHGWCMLEKELELCDDKGDKMEDLKGLLKVGRVVQTKEGKKYLVLPDRLMNYSGYLDLEIYDNNIKSKTYDDFDIVKIFDAPLDKIKHRSWTFGSDIGLELVWERPVKKVFSEKEIVVAECIDKKFKYLARDKNNSLGVYVDKPFKIRGSSFWDNRHSIASMQLFRHLFQQIQFEDDEPTLISDIMEG